MIDLLTREIERIAQARPATGPLRLGRVVSCDGGLIEVAGLGAAIGSLCRIEADGHLDADLSAEVIGFREGHSLLMLLGDQVMLHPGALVRVIGEPGMVDVGPQLLGRAVDGTARPIDGGKRPHPDHRWPLGGRREGALERSSITESFDCGVRAINALATLGIGQRIGILAGSGVGKSMLIDMIASGSTADITIVALIGERGREVSDFVARHMVGAKRDSTIIVAVPADHAPNLRLRGAQYALSLAEFFRARGKRVLLILDSLTRVAHAAREIALLLGEPGAARGYPPSALAAITRLVERAGNSARSGGAITGIFSVLADGDDQDDPVVDTARAILDGHIVLSRELAQRGHYPAIDVPASLSRVMERLIDDRTRDNARLIRALIASWQANRELVMMGAYRAGSDAQLDRALAMRGPIDAFLRQDADDIVSLASSHAQLALLAGQEYVP